jgi:hypothetical protein
MRLKDSNESETKTEMPAITDKKRRRDGHVERFGKKKKTTNKTCGRKTRAKVRQKSLQSQHHGTAQATPEPYHAWTCREREPPRGQQHIHAP